LVLLEALSYGIAIVTTDEGAIAEIIENVKQV
jgi:glycosyltransferase involved in cell wall biosynthesis